MVSFGIKALLLFLKNCTAFTLKANGLFHNCLAGSLWNILKFPNAESSGGQFRAIQQPCITDSTVQFYASIEEHTKSLVVDFGW